MSEKASDAQRDESGFIGCLAMSFALPQRLPIEEGLSSINIDAEYLRLRGATADDVDDAWMGVPFTCYVKWHHLERVPHPAIENASAARGILRAFTDTHELEPSPATPANVLQELTTVAIVLLPVKDRDAALRQTAGKVDPVALAHWILSDVVRSARLATSAPLQDLHYESLTPIIPAKFGAGKSLNDLTFEDAENHLILPRIVNKVAAIGDINLDVLSQHFFELTRGSVSARIRDFIAEAQAAAEGGDQRGALTALALACEFHLDTLLAALLWEEGLVPSDAAHLWENTNVTSRVAQHFSSRLKGNWTRNPGKPIGEWFREVVVVRNSVLHGGRTPKRSEVDRAGEATNRLYAFLAGRLVSNWKRYPKTMSVFVGPKAVRLYAPKNRREEVETQLLAHNRFATGFHRWRDDWLVERSQAPRS